MKKKDLWVIGIILITVGMLSSCSAWENELGKDLLPPGDNVFLFHDTIFEIQAYPVSGKPQVTSENPFQPDPNALYLLGNLEDTIVGTSRATIFTQYNASSTYIPAPNTEIDSVLLYLYIDSYEGDMSEEITIRIHEATTRIYMDSVYFSDYGAEGRYNPVVLAEKRLMPEDNDTVAFLIQDQAFIQKFLDVQADTSLFWSDSVFKDYFKGFYLTATSESGQGAMAKVGLSKLASRLTLKYANDSTEVDSTAERDYVWATFRINEFFTQKINLFEHDHSMTYLSKIIDQESVETPFIYVQGMAGVNTRLMLPDLREWKRDTAVAINSATLIFDVVPEDLSGIALEDLPRKLMVYTELENGTLENLYDYVILSQVESDKFGGILEPVSESMFSDTTYRYRFNMGLHFQSMVDGTKPEYKFRLQLHDAASNPKISKLYSNLSSNPERIRLEIVYLELFRDNAF